MAICFQTVSASCSTAEELAKIPFQNLLVTTANSNCYISRFRHTPLPKSLGSRVSVNLSHATLDRDFVDHNELSFVDCRRTEACDIRLVGRSVCRLIVRSPFG